jgi:hypothetical protein
VTLRVDQLTPISFDDAMVRELLSL